MKKIVRILLFSFFLCVFSVFCKALDIAPYVLVQSKETYDQFISEGDLPDPFLLYEDLSFLGDFRSLQIPNKSMDSYRYRFYDENGIYLSFDSEREIPAYWGDEVSPPEGDFLQNIHAEEYFANSKKVNVRCHCRVGNYLFVYTKGSDGCVRLTDIHWFVEENGKGFSLSWWPEELNLTTPLTGFFGDLLSKERSAAARQQLYDLTVQYVEGGASDGTDSTDSLSVSTDHPTDEGTVDVSTETAPLTDAAPTDSMVDTPSTDGTATDAPLTDGSGALPSDGTDAATTATDAPADPTPFPWLWVIVPAGVILVGGGTAALLLLRKRKKAAKE